MIECGINLSNRLSWLYIQKCDNFKSNINKESVDALIDLGLRLGKDNSLLNVFNNLYPIAYILIILGGFLNDAGWYGDAEKILLSCKEICQSTKQTPYYINLTLECCHR